MIFIWRGFGFLAFLLPLIFGAIGGAVVKDSAVGFGIGMFLGAAVASGLGFWLNGARAKQKADEFVQAQRMRNEQMIQQGVFALPGFPPPRSYEEARYLSEQSLAAEHGRISKQLRGRHSLFWIPMQWAGLGLAVIGLIVAAGALISSSL